MRKSRVVRDTFADTDMRICNDRVPGRAKLKVEGLFRDPELARALESKLKAVEPIRRVSVRSTTGNIIVEFDPSRSHEDALSIIRMQLRGLHAAADAKKAISPGQEAVAERWNAAPHVRDVPRIDRRPQGLEKRRPGPKSADARPSRRIAWHTRSTESVIKELGSDALKGLRTADAQFRLSRYGPNRIAERPPVSPFVVLGRQFASLPVGLLLGASAASVLTGGLADAAVTLAVVAVNAGIGFATESGSERIIRSMTSPAKSSVPVLRDGVERLVDQEQIVPGDVIVLRPNTVITADGRVLAADSLLVNEAMLTGESKPVEKFADAIRRMSTPLGDRVNLVHKGSFVMSGSGRAVIVSTGANTEVGRIEASIAGVETPSTPLERDLDNLGTKLAVMSLVACGAFFGAGLLRGRTLPRMLKSAIALAVAAVPEGLPATATTTLALGLQRLRKKGVIIRRLEAVEGLGSLQVICFDKTGTLTENRMRLERVCVGLSGREPQGAAINRLHEVSILCSEVTFEGNGEGLRPVGSSTEAALAKGALEFGIDPVALRRSKPLLSIDYRSEVDRYMRTVHRIDMSSCCFIAVKGDPHQVLEKCRWLCREDGTLERLTQKKRRRIAGFVDNMAGRAYRVLGFAYAEVPANAIERAELVWVGAGGLRDPVAPGVKDLFVKLHRAGIRPVMITGDQAATAEAIAEEIGLNSRGPIRVLDSGALENIAPEILSAIAQQADVFARVPPTQKLRIVEALQGAGLVVGMTGDGFNDALALKAADIAIAVGADSATSARDVADIIVAEGDLGAIADGIEQGRTILSNIRKAVHYIISTNLSEIIVLLAEAAVANDQLETPMELLWLNLVTDIFPGLGLALEPPERGVMHQRPRSIDMPLFTVMDLRHALLESAVIGGVAIGAHSYGLARYGPGPQTRTVTFLSLVMSQLLHALACRHDRFEPLGGRSLFGNSKLNSFLLGSVALQVIAVAFPQFRRLLGIAAPRSADFAVAGLSALSTFAINETILAVRRPQRIDT